MPRRPRDSILWGFCFYEILSLPPLNSVQSETAGLIYQASFVFHIDNHNVLSRIRSSKVVTSLKLIILRVTRVIIIKCFEHIFGVIDCLEARKQLPVCFFTIMRDNVRFIMEGIELFMDTVQHVFVPCSHDTPLTLVSRLLLY